MYLLSTKKMNLMQELPDIMSANKKQIGNYPSVQKHVSNANSIREDLSFDDEKKLPPQKPTLTIRQEKLEQYIKILFNMNMIIDIPKKFFTPYQFKWSGKISSSTFTNANFYYEIAANFYNYGVMYFNQGQALLADPANQKNALKFFRLSMWGFDQAEKAAQRSLSTGNVVPELTGANIQGVKAVAAAHAYRVLYLLMREKFPSFSLEQRTSFHKNAYQEAYKACAMLEKTSCDQFVEPKKIKKIVNFFKLFHICSILLEKSIEYETKHKEELTKGHIGIQLAFIENLKEFKGELKDVAESLKDPEVTDLQKKVEQELAKLPSLELENEEVYKAPVPARDKLPPIPESEYKISPLEQPGVKTVLEDLPKDLKSSAFAELDSNFTLLVSKNKNNLNSIIEGMNRKKNEEYRKNNIDVLVRLGGASEESLSEKLKQIKDLYGGYSGYSKQIALLNKTLGENDAGMRKMVGIIEQDDYQDQVFYKTYGIKIMGLKDPNNPFMKNFERQGVALTSLKQRDGEINKEFETQAGLLKKIDEGTFLKELESMKTKITNSEELQTLVKKEQGLNEVIRLHLEPQKNQLMNDLSTSNSLHTIQEIFFLNQNTETTYSELSDSLHTKIENFTEKVSKINQAIDSIGQLSSKVNASLGKDNTNIVYQQKAMTDVNNVCVLYQSIMNNLEMHQNIRKNGEVLSQLLDDYIMSKQMQKQEIINNINAFKNMGSYFEKLLETQMVNNPFFRR